MRRIRYQVAMSLDGFIADENDGYGWIPEEPDFDFQALFAQFDTLLVGRRTFEQVPGMARDFVGKDVYVFSSSLQQADHPDVKIVGNDFVAELQELKSRPGLDIWLYGGGELFRSLLQAGLVDTVEPAVVPVMLGKGRRFLPETGGPITLVLEGHDVYPTGLTMLRYRIAY